MHWFNYYIDKYTFGYLLLSSIKYVAYFDDSIAHFVRGGLPTKGNDTIS